MLPLLHALTAATIFANSPGVAVRVQHRGPAEITTHAGRAVSTSFALQNLDSKTYKFSPTIELPAGWRAVSEAGELQLTAGASAMRVLTILVPRNASAGGYTVRLSATINGERATDSVRVFVAKNLTADLTLEAAPPMLVNGATWQGTLVVRNGGNSAADFRVLLDTVGAVSVAPRVFDVRLEMGELRTMSYRLTARGDLDRKVRGRVVASVVAAGDSIALASAHTAIDVVPRPREVSTLLHSIPSHVRVRVEPGDSLMWAEFAGEGVLRENGSTAVNFMLRGPSFEPTMFGERPEYWLELKNPRFHARGGDQLFILSPLTHEPQYGFGFAADATIGSFKTAGFRYQNRFVTNGPATSGASVGMLFGPRREVSVNTVIDEARDAATTSLRAQFNAVRVATLETELGFNTAGPAAGRAYAVRFRGDLQRFSYDGYLTRTDPTYSGARPGTNANHLTATYRLPVGMELSVGARAFSHRTEAADSLSVYNYHESVYNAQLAWRDYLSAELISQRWSNSFGTYDVDRSGQIARIRARAKAGSMTITPLLETGLVHEQDSDENNRYARGELNISFNRGNAGYVSGGVHYTFGPTLFRPESEGAAGASLDANVAIGSRTSISLNGQLQREQTAGITTDVVFGRLQLEQRLFGSHQFAVRAQVASFMRTVLDEGPSVAFEYQLPLGIPIARARASAHIVGRLIDDATGKPVPDIVITLGERAVATDQEGRFSFPNVEPGEHYLQLDPMSLPVGYVLNVPQPLHVVVKPASTTQWHLALVRKARVTGSVQLIDSAGTVTPLRGAVVELVRDGEVQRRTSSEDGRIEFNDLRPGQWQVRIIQAQLPPHFVFGEFRSEIDAAPGTERQFVLSARAKQRSIRLQEEKSVQTR